MVEKPQVPWIDQNFFIPLYEIGVAVVGGLRLPEKPVKAIKHFHIGIILCQFVDGQVVFCNIAVP